MSEFSGIDCIARIAYHSFFRTNSVIVHILTITRLFEDVFLKLRNSSHSLILLTHPKVVDFSWNDIFSSSLLKDTDLY